jgi:hypothetical protein
MNAAQIVPNLLARAALEAWAKGESADAGRAAPAGQAHRSMRAPRRLARPAGGAASFAPPPLPPAALASAAPFVFSAGEGAEAAMPARFDGASVFAAGAPRAPATLRRRSVSRQPADTRPLEV